MYVLENSEKNAAIATYRGKEITAVNFYVVSESSVRYEGENEMLLLYCPELGSRY